MIEMCRKKLNINKYYNKIQAYYDGKKNCCWCPYYTNTHRVTKFQDVIALYTSVAPTLTFGIFFILTSVRAFVCVCVCERERERERGEEGGLFP